MKVKTPILSVRELIPDGHDAYINKNGGWIKNIGNGKTITFFEFQGVYYLKMKIDKPTANNEKNDEPLFSGQGA